MNKTAEKEKEIGYTIDDLTWTRLISPQFVPKDLIEQIKHREYSVDDFNKFHSNNCEIMIDGQKRLNPFSHLYALLDPKFKVRGVLWFSIDPLSKCLVIQTYSVEKEFWGMGKAVQKLIDMVLSIKEGATLSKVYWITNYPKHSERYGFKRSKSILMEYSGDALSDRHY